MDPSQPIIKQEGRKLPYLLLPDETWLRIFRLVLDDGHYPAMLRLSLVCHHWYQLCSNCTLWRRVNLVHPNIQGIPCTDKSLELLSLRHGKSIHEINLGYWEQLTSEGLKIFAQNCPELRSVTLTGCPKLPVEIIPTLTEYCKKLRRVDLSKNSPDLVSAASIGHVTQSVGRDLKSLIFSKVRLYDFSHLMNILCENCPDLEQLMVGNCCDRTVTFDIERWQHFLPRIRFLYLCFIGIEVMDVPEPTRDSAGWPNLQRLSLEMDSSSDDELEFSMDKSLLERFLRDSSSLERLDLRHNCDVSASEMLSLDLSNIRHLAMAKKFWTDVDGVKKFFTKHASRLETLYILGECLTESEIHNAIQALIKAPIDRLNFLSLEFTPVAQQDVVDIITVSRNLAVIDLTDCDLLPSEWSKRFSRESNMTELDELVIAYIREQG